ncbi:hypothetical protein D3C79_945760 [compost metagenome]
MRGKACQHGEAVAVEDIDVVIAGFNDHEQVQGVGSVLGCAWKTVDGIEHLVAGADLGIAPGRWCGRGLLQVGHQAVDPG